MLKAHGKPRTLTWTRLASTAAAGSTSLKLQAPVDWVAGESIVVAASGFIHTESEVMTIQSIANGTDIILTQPLV